MGGRDHTHITLVCYIMHHSRKFASVRDLITKNTAESSQVCKKRSYDAALKLKVIKFAEQNTNKGATRLLGCMALMKNEFVSGKSKRSNLGA